MIHRRPGAKFVASLPKGEPVVAMVVFKGQVLVATGRRVLRLRGNHFQPMIFEVPK